MKRSCQPLHSHSRLSVMPVANIAHVSRSGIAGPLQHGGQISGPAAKDKAHAEIEDAGHLAPCDAAARLDDAEDWWHIPRASVQYGGEMFRHDTRQVVNQATAGDVRHASDEAVVEQRANGKQIASVWLEQLIAERPSELRQERGKVVVREDVAGKRISVRMQAGGG